MNSQRKLSSESKRGKDGLTKIRKPVAKSMKETKKKAVSLKQKKEPEVEKKVEGTRKNFVLANPDSKKRKLAKEEIPKPGKKLKLPKEDSLERNDVVGKKVSLKVKSKKDVEPGKTKTLSKVEAKGTKAKKPLKLMKSSDSGITELNSKRNKAHKTDLQVEEENIVTKSDKSKAPVKTKKGTNLESKKLSKSTSLKLKNLGKRKGSKVELTGEESLSGESLSQKNVEKAVSAVLKLIKQDLKEKNTLFPGEMHQILMHVNCIKVPLVSTRRMRMSLPHSIITDSDEVALFVKDLQKGNRRDFEPTIEHFQELLQQHGCTRIKDVIPMIQVKTEFDQFELKRKLVGSYDAFLVDGRIAGHMSHLLGKIFRDKHKAPIPIKMGRKDLKEEIENALKKTSLLIHSNGDCHTLPVAHSGMKASDIVENILAAGKFLAENYPGGWNNIRALRIKGEATLAVPIYLNLKCRNDVEIPIIPPKRPKNYGNVEGELTTLEGNATVTVTPEGEVVIDHEFEVSDDEEEIPKKKGKKKEDHYEV